MFLMLNLPFIIITIHNKIQSLIVGTYHFNGISNRLIYNSNYIFELHR